VIRAVSPPVPPVAFLEAAAERATVSSKIISNLRPAEAAAADASPLAAVP